MIPSSTDVSIITSLYRSEAYVRPYTRWLRRVAKRLAAASVVHEVIVIANDATPSEREGLRQLRNQLEPVPACRLVVTHVPRETLYRSWNRGIALSTGRRITFWNVDDVRYPEAIIEGLRAIEGGTSLVYFPYWWVRKLRLLSFLPIRRRTLIFPPPFERPEFIRQMHCGPFFIFERGLFEDIGPFDEQFTSAGDFDWCARAARVTDFLFMNAIAGEFTDRETGLSTRRSRIHQTENNVVYLRHGATDKVSNLDEALMKRYRVNHIEHSVF